MIHIVFYLFLFQLFTSLRIHQQLVQREDLFFTLSFHQLLRRRHLISFMDVWLFCSSPSPTSNPQASEEDLDRSKPVKPGTLPYRVSTKTEPTVAKASYLL